MIGYCDHIMTFAQTPIALDRVSPQYIDMQILRTAIAAELDAINLYEQMGYVATDKRIKTVLHSVSVEEKTHIGEFQAMLVDIDTEQRTELDKGGKEVMEMFSAPSPGHRGAKTFYPVMRVR